MHSFIVLYYYYAQLIAVLVDINMTRGPPISAHFSSSVVKKVADRVTPIKKKNNYAPFYFQDLDRKVVDP